MITLLALQAAFACASPYIHDGDNIRCGGRSMRLARIDAPKLRDEMRRCVYGERAAWSGRCSGPTRGEEARDHLRALVRGQAVTCRVVDASPQRPGFQSADQHGRPVVTCSVPGVGDLGEAQVRAGHARRWR
jgi:endonuclease YncB( thermonuclease family)